MSNPTDEDMPFTSDVTYGSPAYVPPGLEQMLYIAEINTSTSRFIFSAQTSPELTGIASIMEVDDAVNNPPSTLKRNLVVDEHGWFNQVGAGADRHEPHSRRRRIEGLGASSSGSVIQIPSSNCMALSGPLSNTTWKLARLFPNQPSGEQQMQHYEDRIESLQIIHKRDHARNLIFTQRLKADIVDLNKKLKTDIIDLKQFFETHSKTQKQESERRFSSLYNDKMAAEKLYQASLQDQTDSAANMSSNYDRLLALMQCDFKKRTQERDESDARMAAHRQNQLALMEQDFRKKIQERDEVDARMAAHHKSQLASMKHDFQKQIQERDEDHSSMAASYESKFASMKHNFKKQMQEIDEKHDRETIDNETRREEEKFAYRDGVARMNAQFQQDLNTKKNEYSDRCKKTAAWIETKRTEYDARWNQLVESHKEKIAVLKEAFENNIASIKRNHRDHIAVLEQASNSNASLKAQHELELREALKAQEKNHNQITNTKIDQIKSDYERRISDQQTTYQADLASLQNDLHEADGRYAEEVGKENNHIRAMEEELKTLREKISEAESHNAKASSGPGSPPTQTPPGRYPPGPTGFTPSDWRGQGNSTSSGHETPYGQSRPGIPRPARGASGEPPSARFGTRTSAPHFGRMPPMAEEPEGPRLFSNARIPRSFPSTQRRSTTVPSRQTDDEMYSDAEGSHLPGPSSTNRRHEPPNESGYEADRDTRGPAPYSFLGRGDTFSTKFQSRNNQFSGGSTPDLQSILSGLFGMFVPAMQNAANVSTQTSRRRTRRGKKDPVAAAIAHTKATEGTEARNSMSALCREVVFCSFSDDIMDVSKMYDFRFVSTATEEMIAAVEGAESFPGFLPDDTLFFDFTKTFNSPFNDAVINTLCARYQLARADSRIRISTRPQEYVHDKFAQLFKSARGIWKGAQAKRRDDGSLETVDEVAGRVQLEERDNLLRQAACTRRNDKFERRLAITEDMIVITQAERSPYQSDWIFLEKLVVALGPEGQSSDEEDKDSGTMERRYKTKRLPWRREMDIHMHYMDTEHVKQAKARNAPGCLPSIRVPGRSLSNRSAPDKLPINLYDQDWIKRKGESYVERFIQPVQEEFEFLGPIG